SSSDCSSGEEYNGCIIAIENRFPNTKVADNPTTVSIMNMIFFISIPWYGEVLFNLANARTAEISQCV
ncbi:MAG: hypothetical protein ACRD8W_30550, partial [Nitrososphaeraceae archaeon]